MYWVHFVLASAVHLLHENLRFPSLHHKNLAGKVWNRLVVQNIQRYRLTLWPLHDSNKCLIWLHALLNVKKVETAKTPQSMLRKKSRSNFYSLNIWTFPIDKYMQNAIMSTMNMPSSDNDDKYHPRKIVKYSRRHLETDNDGAQSAHNVLGWVYYAHIKKCKT